MPCYEPPDNYPVPQRPPDPERQRTVQLLAWTLNERGLPLPTEDVDATAKLCSLLKSLTENEREALVYNAHSRISRDLANWWEDHQDLDAKRQSDS